MRLRWDPAATSKLPLAPTLPPQLRPGILLRGIRYQGRWIAIHIEPHSTSVMLESGEPLRIEFPGGAETVTQGQSVEIPTFTPDIASSSNLALCRPIEATSAARANPPAAAVDGNPVTSWRAQSATSSLTIVLGDDHQSGSKAVSTSRAEIHWGATRPQSFTVSLETAAGTWHEVASGRAAKNGATPVHWQAAEARKARFSFSGGLPASITELEMRKSSR